MSDYRASSNSRICFAFYNNAPQSKAVTVNNKRKIFSFLMRLSWHRCLSAVTHTLIRADASIDASIASVSRLRCSGLSLRFQVAGYLLLVAGEVASSHEAPTPKKFLKYNFYHFPKGITDPKKAIFVKSRAIISDFMMVTSLLKKTTTFWDTKIISFYFT